MKWTRKWMMVVAVLPALLGACAGAPAATQVELPQQFRIPQANLVTMFERRSGRIAVIDARGNLVIMDQTGGAVTPITRDADVISPDDQSATRSQTVTRYNYPVWSPDASRIAFVEITTERTVTSRVIEYGLDAVTVQRGSRSMTVEESDFGRQTRSLPNTTSTERQPSRVTIEVESGGDLIVSSLHVANTDGKTPLNELTSARDRLIGYADWSSEGAQLALLGQRRDGMTEISTISAAGGKVNVLAVGAEAAWAWHPGGKALVAKVDRNAVDYSADLSVLDTQSNQVAAAVVKNGALPFLAPAFSPDGNSVLLTTQSAGQQYLAQADREGKVQQLLAQADGVLSFSWAPDGSQVAFIARLPDDDPSALPGGTLHVVDVATREDRVLSRVPVIAFFWSPDSERLAVVNPVRPADISADFPGVNLASSNASVVYMLQNLHVRSGDTRQLFYFEPTDDFRAMLSQFDRFSRSATIWAPDSKHLVLPVVTYNQQGRINLILETESSGSIQPRVISQGTLAVWSPR